ncbi:SAV_6107 family HEPN domain-containing protein [Rhodococcus sp. SGAir0479]|uniref:SAV_6107 family HEPN domain-containing protein n=1 Tax=Rhodococcus sp. SGAir0479 TaxID=2567884 RepID=UPI0034A0B148
MSDAVSKMRPRSASIVSGARRPGAAPCADGGRSRRGALVRAGALLRRADGLLSESVGAGAPAERFRCAYLAALKGAAAVLAASEGQQAPARRPRSRSAWVLMARTAPQFGEWADYFAAHSALRAAIEAGVDRGVSDVDADRFYAEAGRFLTAVEDFLAEQGADDTYPGISA